MTKGIHEHEFFMMQAFKLAEKALEKDEVPVGAVIVKNGRIIGRGYNQTEMLNDPTAHAEMLAISSACSTVNNKYLKGCTLYVTLEPCPMCAGAIIWSKIDRVVFAAMDSRRGACGSRLDLLKDKSMNHHPEVIHGIMELDSSYLLKMFFKEKRDSNF